MSVFEYYVKIQIWKKNNHCHLHIATKDEPNPTFLNFQDNWTLKNTFFAFSSEYRGLLSRNYKTIVFKNYLLPPYQTYFISDDQTLYFSQNEQNGDRKFKTNSFIALLNPFENQFKNIETTPLEIKIYIDDVDVNLLLNYQKAKNKIWYDIPYPENQFLVHVFSTFPTNLYYWRANTENTCIPCVKEQAQYNTVLECVMDNSKNILKNKKIFVGTNSNQYYNLYNQTSPFEQSNQAKKILFSFFVILVATIMIILLALLAMKRTEKNISK